MRVKLLLVGAMVATGCGGGAEAIIDASIGDGAIGADAAGVDGAGVDADHDAPAIDAPTPDAPAVDAPMLDAPAIDASTPDAPAIDAPMPDAPAIDAPAIDAPVGPVDAAVPFLLGPTAYLSVADAPWSAGDFTVFYREDFEDGVLDTPGVVATAYQMSSTFGAEMIDSVDADDGTIDGACQIGCDALWANGTVTFTFDADALGGLPTAVGVVWTDGGPGSTVVFEAFAADRTPLGNLMVPGIPDGDTRGGTAEDRFFGVRYGAGVGSIRIGNTSGGIEVDHLQYGR